MVLFTKYTQIEDKIKGTVSQYYFKSDLPYKYWIANKKYTNMPLWCKCSTCDDVRLFTRIDDRLQEIIYLGTFKLHVTC